MKAAIDHGLDWRVEGVNRSSGGDSPPQFLASAATETLKVGWCLGEGEIFQAGLRTILAAEPDLECLSVPLLSSAAWKAETCDALAPDTHQEPAARLVDPPQVMVLDADQPSPMAQAATLQVVLPADVSVTGSAASPGCGHEMVSHHHPEWRRLAEQFSGSRFVLLAARPGPGLRRLANQAGIHWVLNKRCSGAELAAAIRSAHRGVVPSLSVRPMGQAAFSSHGEFGIGSLAPELTPRQVVLLQAMAQGLSNQQIADKFNIALPTVKFHVAGIMIKLQADNRTAAVITGLRLGIVHLD